MKNEMYLVATIQTSVDGDGCDQYSMDVCVLPKEKALSRISGKTYTLGNKTICICKGAEGRCGWGGFGDCYLVVCPADNGFINGGEIAGFMDREYWAEHDARREVEQMEKELEKADEPAEIDEFEIDYEELPYATGIIRDLARRHRKKGKKARRHLATIYPISTDSIRKTQNGAYIHKGNTHKWNSEWKRLDTKARREAGKSEIRHYLFGCEIEFFDDEHQTDEERRIANLNEYIQSLMHDLETLKSQIDMAEEWRTELIKELYGVPKHWSF